MTEFNINSTKKIQIKNGLIQESYELPKDLQESNFKQAIKKANFDKINTKKLEEVISSIINKHLKILSQANLPDKIDIEFIRTKKLEQFFHSLSWNKNKKTYAEIKQPKSYSDKNPKIIISTDFVQDFFNINFSIFGHEFLGQLRKEFNNSDNKKTKQIITELTFFHELGHVVFNSKIQHTFLKYGYEVKNEKLPTIKNFSRLINEGFADGFCTCLTNLDFPNEEIFFKYKKIRETTEFEKLDKLTPKQKENAKNNIQIYEVSEIFGNLKLLSNLNIINEVFNISLQNALKVINERINQSAALKNNLEKELVLLDRHGIFQYNQNKNLIQNLEDNVKEQLNNPFSPLFVKPEGKSIQNNEQLTIKEKCMNKMNCFLDKFRNNTSSNDNKFKP
jgi:hypothetical protein